MLKKICFKSIDNNDGGGGGEKPSIFRTDVNDGRPVVVVGGGHQ